MESLHYHHDFFTDHFTSGMRLFFRNTGIIPSYLTIRRLDFDKAHAWLLNTYGAGITLSHQKGEWKAGSKKSFRDREACYFLEDGPLLINLDESYGATIYYAEETAAANELTLRLAAALGAFRQRVRRQQEYNVVVDDGKGLGLYTLDLPKAKIHTASHYNEDLLALGPQLLKTLASKKEKGLHLFHGTPGTGKSTYIRHLIGKVRGKDFIFLSPHVAARLDSPQLIPLLLRHPSSILIIEDAEELLMNRRSGRNSAISFLLNLTDGLLGESLNIQVLCTFNTSIEALDPALLRKGRLKTCYEFGPLSPQKSAALAESITGKPAPAKALTLADIYNWQAEDHAKVTSRSRIGFALA